MLKDAGVKISMDGKGRWMDNVFIERLWRSLKYEQVYLAEYATGSEARAGIGWWIDFYNERRPHSSLGDRHPRGGLRSRGCSETGATPRLLTAERSSLNHEPGFHLRFAAELSQWADWTITCGSGFRAIASPMPPWPSLVMLSS